MKVLWLSFVVTAIYAAHANERYTIVFKKDMTCFEAMSVLAKTQFLIDCSDKSKPVRAYSARLESAGPASEAIRMLLREPMVKRVMPSVSHKLD